MKGFTPRVDHNPERGTFESRTIQERKPSSLVNLLATSIAKHSRVVLPMMVNSRNARPSFVRYSLRQQCHSAPHPQFSWLLETPCNSRLSLVPLASFPASACHKRPTRLHDRATRNNSCSASPVHLPLSSFLATEG